jgi:hypothetical protein
MVRRVSLRASALATLSLFLLLGACRRPAACDALMACCAAAGAPPSCTTAGELRDPSACRALQRDVSTALTQTGRPVPASCALEAAPRAAAAPPSARYDDPAGRYSLVPPATFRAVAPPAGALAAWEAPDGVHAHVVLDPAAAPSLAAYGEGAAHALRERGWHVAIAEIVWRGASPAYHLFSVRAGGGVALDQHFVPVGGQFVVLAASAARHDTAAAAGRALLEALSEGRDR